MADEAVRAIPGGDPRYGGWPIITSFDLGVLRLQRAGHEIEREPGTLERYRVDGSSGRTRRHVLDMISRVAALASPPTEEEHRELERRALSEADRG